MAWTANFYTAIRNQANWPRRILVYDGVEYEDEIISVSAITRNNSLAAGTVRVTVNNADKAFIGRIYDNTWDQQRGYVKIYFEDLETEKMSIFSGIPFKVEYVGKNAVIYLRDNMAKMLNRPVGTWETPVNYYSLAYNPADLVWAILTDTDYGNLDNTASAANTDIDYTQWSAWKTDMTNSSYSLKGRFTSQTIRDILLRVCELTDSYIWVNGSGLFEFAMLGGSSQMTGSENYTSDNIKLSEDIPFLTIDTDHIWNSIQCYYDYSVVEDKWIPSTVGISTDTTSIGIYGKHNFVEQDTSIWHADSDSCSSFRTAFLNRYKDPHTMLGFETFMASWLEEVTYTVSVTWSLFNISSITMTITEMTILPMEGKTRMSLWWPWPHT